jgi:deoxyribonuclease-4
MDKYYYGSHISTYKGIPNSIKEMKKLGGNFLQIFITNPIGSGIKKITNKELKEINDLLIQNDMKIVIHSPYILNFAKPFDDKSWWINVLIRELKITSKFNSYGSVLHLGKEKYKEQFEYIDLKKSDGYDNMYKSIKYVLDNTPDNSKIILETSSGQGSEMGYKLDDFANKLYNKFSKKYKKRLGICLDTCHMFAAGYDLTTNNNIKKLFKKIDNLFGIHNIWLIHLNDSKYDLGSKLDRHASLGEGKIGKKSLKYIIKIAYKLNIPIILETPSNPMEEIQYIKKIINKL